MSACCVFGMPVEIRFESIIETSAEREARLTRERDQARRERDAYLQERNKYMFQSCDCVKVCNEANVVNADDIRSAVILTDKIKRLRSFAEMAEHAESELRAEVQTLREELADAYAALASHTDRLASLAA